MVNVGVISFGAINIYVYIHICRPSQQRRQAFDTWRTTHRHSWQQGHDSRWHIHRWVLVTGRGRTVHTSTHTYASTQVYVCVSAFVYASCMCAHVQTWASVSLLHTNLPCDLSQCAANQNKCFTKTHLGCHYHGML